MKIITFNTEGISDDKAELLSNLKPDILCLQETHRDSKPPSIPGMHLIIHHGSRVHGSAIFARDKSIIVNSEDLSEQGQETLKVETTKLTICSIYKPPPSPFQWPKIETRTQDAKPLLAIGDFNSHNTIWGYQEHNEDGESVEEWAASNDLAIVHNQKDKPSFYSARWKRGYNPDLVFVSTRHFTNFNKCIGKPIPKSQHRPVIIEVKPAVQPLETNGIPRFNFRKARWPDFTAELDKRITETKLDPEPKNYQAFQKLVWETSLKSIPRGCRKTYIPGMNTESKQLYEEYIKAYNSDPFAEETIQLGEDLTSSLSTERSKRWKEMIENTDMTKNSKKAWTTIKKLNTEKKAQTRVAAVTPNEVANQLLLNGKPLHKQKGMTKSTKRETDKILKESSNQLEDFTKKELEDAMALLKTGKAAGLDNITTEMIQHFGTKTRTWLLAFLNKCAQTSTIPRAWRRAKVAALLKPGKDPNHKKSYRPISLLCILYKLYERMILARISQSVEEQLTPDQAGFRPGRSCCDQLLNLTQYIEDGFETKQITGAVFVDLTAAYDTVNHRLLLNKVAKVVKNAKIFKIIQSLLSNRRFYVEMDGRKSRWRTQKNGLPQGSVLAPTLFNVYTNDQPEFEAIRRFIYADDLCLATQGLDFKIIEKRLSEALNTLTEYYRQNSLNANPGKTQVCAFHLNNHEANKKLNITWNGQILENDSFPVYLGVTLDRTLSFKEHARKVKAKVATRNNLLGKLANSNWGANPSTLRSTALALSYSTAEYCSPVWANSCHAKSIDPELNNACRIITGTLRPTPLPALHRLAGIAPPQIRRETQLRTQKYKQENDKRHPLHDHIPPRSRLESRRSFMTAESLNPDLATKYRTDQWTQRDTCNNNAIQPPKEALPNGTDIPRKDWVALNRARAKVGKTASTLHKWKLAETSKCPCGSPNQTMQHVLTDCSLGPVCTDRDLLMCNRHAKTWLRHWRDKI